MGVHGLIHRGCDGGVANPEGVGDLPSGCLNGDRLTGVSVVVEQLYPRTPRACFGGGGVTTASGADRFHPWGVEKHGPKEH